MRPTKKTYNFGTIAPESEEMPGISVFAKDGGAIYHTYSTYSRGIDMVNGTYQLLDLVPKGRDEDGLDFSMEWVRRRDEYQNRNGRNMMPTLEIIGIPQSNYVWVVRMVCEEKGVPYEHKPDRPHSPAIDAIHPFGKVPVMRHGDVELCESKAIATYIDRVFDGPKVIPEDPARAAQVEQWVSLGNVEFDKLMIRQYVVALRVSARSPASPTWRRSRRRPRR